MAGFGELCSVPRLSLTRSFLSVQYLRVSRVWQGLAAQARSLLMKPVSEAKLQTLSIAVWLGSKANTNVLFPSILQATYHSAKP